MILTGTSQPLKIVDRSLPSINTNAETRMTNAFHNERPKPCLTFSRKAVSSARIINNGICAISILREFGDPCGLIADHEI